jgi:hypothetical protein
MKIGDFKAFSPDFPLAPSPPTHQKRAARVQLLTEMAGLAAVDELDRWAYRRLSIKNTLSATDARLVDEAFQAKLTAVGDPDEDGIEAPHSSPESGHPVLPQGQQETQRREEIISYGIDKSLLTIPEPRRLRDKIYLRLVAKHR